MAYIWWMNQVSRDSMIELEHQPSLPDGIEYPPHQKRADVKVISCRWNHSITKHFHSRGKLEKENSKFLHFRKPIIGENQKYIGEWKKKFEHFTLVFLTCHLWQMYFQWKVWRRQKCYHHGQCCVWSLHPPGKPQDALDFLHIFGEIYRDCWMVHNKMSITDQIVR